MFIPSQNSNIFSISISSSPVSLRLDRPIIFYNHLRKKTLRKNNQLRKNVNIKKILITFF